MAEELSPLLEGVLPTSPEGMQTRHEQREGERYFSSVGRLATEWAAFEHTIQIEIWKFINIDYQIGACLTSQIGQSGRLMDCLIALFVLRGADDDHLKQIRSFSTKVGDYQRRRNRIIHDPWFFDFSDKKETRALRMEISASKRPVFEPFTETKEGLIHLIIDIIALSDELEKLVLAKPLKPWPEKLPLPSSLQRLDRGP